MNRDSLLKLHEHHCGAARALMQKKNADYSGGSEDILSNFRAYEQLGVCSIEAGITSRMVDKMSRIAGMAGGHEAQVTDETAEDTVRDLINYGILLLAARDERAMASQLADQAEGDSK